MIWTAVLVASLCCAGLKLAGWSLPQRLLVGDRLQRAATLLPVALLAALVAVQMAAERDGAGPRLAGVAVAAGLLALRAPFLVVILAAAATAAGLRAL